MSDTTSDTVLAPRQIADALAAPFDPAEVKFKPQMVKDNRALAMAYIDARLIQDRLDEVVGVLGWQDAYRILSDGSVMCRLSVLIGDEWVRKCDVGSPSEQPDQGDRLKAAFSDALKRAAVKFGIGRYLYRLKAQWVDYDPQKRQIVNPPQLPAWALPASAKAAPAAARTTAQPASEKPAEKPAAQPAPATTGGKLPANGQELYDRLKAYGAKLAQQGLCAPDALVIHVTKAGVKAGYPAVVANWSGPAIKFAADVTKDFEAKLRQGEATRRQPPPDDITPGELIGRLTGWDSRLAEVGLITVGQLLAHVTESAVRAGLGADFSKLNPAGIKCVLGWAKEFEDTVTDARKQAELKAEEDKQRAALAAAEKEAARKAAAKPTGKPAAKPDPKKPGNQTRRR